MNSIETLRAQVKELHAGLKETKTDWALCKKTVAGGVLNTNVAPPMRIKTKEVWSKRDAQEIENFL